MTRSEFATVAESIGLTYAEARAIVQREVLKVIGRLERAERAVENERAALATEDAELEAFFEPFADVSAFAPSGRHYWRRCDYCNRGFWAKVAHARFCPEPRRCRKHWHRREKRLRENGNGRHVGMAEAA